MERLLWGHRKEINELYLENWKGVQRGGEFSLIYIHGIHFIGYLGALNKMHKMKL